MKAWHVLGLGGGALVLALVVGPGKTGWSFVPQTLRSEPSAIAASHYGPDISDVAAKTRAQRHTNDNAGFEVLVDGRPQPFDNSWAPRFFGNWQDLYVTVEGHSGATMDYYARRNDDFILGLTAGQPFEFQGFQGRSQRDPESLRFSLRTAKQGLYFRIFPGATKRPPESFLGALEVGPDVKPAPGRFQVRWPLSTPSP